MKYLVVVDAGTNVLSDEFETLSEANGEAFYVYSRYQLLPWYSPERNYHIYVATPAADGDGDMDIEDNYFDSKTFYLPREERDFDALWYEITKTIMDNENLDFVLDNGKFFFSVPYHLIENHHYEETDEFDYIGGEIIFDYYKKAVREKTDEILAFYELD